MAARVASPAPVCDRSMRAVKTLSSVETIAGTGLIRESMPDQIAPWYRGGVVCCGCEACEMESWVVGASTTQ